VYSMAVQPDGDILIAGAFTAYSGTARNRIARLNADGSLDSSFSVGTGANSTIRSVVLQSDGKILIGGSFTSYNGVARGRIARLNADGSLDVGFNQSAGPNSTVNSISLQPDGKVLIGGGFTTINGVARFHCARLNEDGSLDSGFVPATVAVGAIASLSLQDNGKVVVACVQAPEDIGSVLARFNADGSLDSGFNVGAADGNIQSIALQSDGMVVIGGLFSS